MARVLLLIGIIAFVSPLFGQTSSPSASPSLEQRVVDLEAYINNSSRGSDSSGIASNIAGSGPGYNAWMMTCAALVLFMTLPGLALFFRWPCSREECPFCSGAMPRHCRAGHDSLVGSGLFPRVFARISFHRRFKVCVSERKSMRDRTLSIRTGFRRMFSRCIS
jgi:hypothetical protein